MVDLAAVECTMDGGVGRVADAAGRCIASAGHVVERAGLPTGGRLVRFLEGD